MTIEQIKQKILDKRSQIKSLEMDIEGLKNNLCEFSPFQVGDKVNVIDTNYGIRIKDYGTLFVSELSIESNLKFLYRFTLPKKDGTMGQRGSGIWAFNSDNLIITKL